MASIGAHVYGGTLNSASVIGPLGNPYDDYLAAFELKVPNDGLNLLPVTGHSAKPSVCPNCQSQLTCSFCNKQPKALAPAPVSNNECNYLNGSTAASSAMTCQVPSLTIKKPITPRMRQTSRFIGPQSSQFKNEEGFFDFMKKAVSVGAPLLGGALKAGLSLALGPLGVPIGCLAGVALNAAGKLAESTEAESGGLDLQTIHDGTIERAILAEAALTAVTSMNLHPEEEEGIFSDMRDYVVKAAPIIRAVAPKVLAAMVEPALRIAVDSLHTYNQRGSAEGFYGEIPQPFRNPIIYSNQIHKQGAPEAEAFLAGVGAALQSGQESLDGESEEGFFDIVRAGLGMVGKVAQIGLPILANALSESTDAESAEADNPAAAAGALSSDDLAKRAMAGEAALQALMKLPAHRLEEEGFFDSIASAIKSIAPVVMKVAPVVLSNVGPIFGTLVKAATGQEALFVSAPRAQGSKPVIRKKPSMLNVQAGRSNQPNVLLSKIRDFHEAQVRLG